MELIQAEFLDNVCRRWPGYTLSGVLAEDAHLLLSTLAILNEAREDDDGE